MKVLGFIHSSFVFCCILLSLSTCVYSQTDYKKLKLDIPKKLTNNPRDIKPGFNAEIKNIELPVPSGDSYRSFLLKQKAIAKSFHQQKQHKGGSKFTSKNTPQPIIKNSFEPYRVHSNGNIIPVYAGIPSDNTVAVSNDGIVLTAMNSVLHAYDLNNDTLYFEESIIFLRPFVEGFSSSSYYDPKLFYDPGSDRFILVFLKDFDPDNSEVIICFSSSSDPNDPWHIYNLPGNPLDNNRWTDFPAIAVTDDKLYFTANLIIPDVSWQVGFDGSIIWEMDKLAGYQGANDISATLYHDIKYNGGFIRNLHPVQGAEGIADELFLLSNRNFDIENDTIFMVNLFDDQLSVDPVITDVPYGVPPNARQFDTDLTDTTSGLQTNDARVLGAYLHEDVIHYVANTMNPETGFSGIYHGIIHDVYHTPNIQGKIIGDSIKDYGYPNIAWSGNEPCDQESIIGFNFSSFDHYPGVAALYYDNDGNYSPVKTLKDGYNFVDRLPTGYERWGDYFGLQRKYNEPGIVSSFGYLAMPNKSNSGFYATLKSPDSTYLQVESVINYESLCSHSISVEPISGTPPYMYYWQNSNESTSNNIFNNVCAGDTVQVTVVDQKGCSYTEAIYVSPKTINSNSSVFPNPSSDLTAVQFELENDALIKVELYDMNGKRVQVIKEQFTKKGLNELSFSTAPLSAGVYQILLFADDQYLEEHRFVKQ